MLKAARNDRKERREQQHAAALVDLYATANQLALLYHTWSTIQPGKGWWAELRFGIQMFGYTKMILERLWRVTDHFWDASGRARSVATAEELAVINGIENVIGDWQMGEPLPDAWGLAIRRLRALVESREPVAEDPPAPPAD